MPRLVPLSRTLEELENDPWPPPTGTATGLVRAFHALRRRPVGALTADELERLIGQDVGLLFLLPVALTILRDTLPAQREGGWYDEGLLSAALTRGPAVWETDPECAHGLRAIVADLRPPLPSHLRRSIERFRASLPPDPAGGHGEHRRG